MDKQAPKKLIVKNFIIPQLPGDEYMSLAWARLEEAVTAIQKSKSVQTSLQTLSNNVENLCQPKFVKQMYEKLKELINSHTKSSIEELNNIDIKYLAYLQAINTLYKNHCQQLRLIRNIFLFLDRTHVLSNPNILSIWDLGLDKFRHYFLTTPNTQTKTIDGILGLIKAEREGDKVDKQLIKDLLFMLTNLSIYFDTFEPRFIQETELLYRLSSEKLVHKCAVPDYLRYVDKSISEEMERHVLYLDPTTKEPLLRVVEKELIITHMTFIITKGMDDLLQHMKIQDLSLMYSLLSRVKNGPQEVCQHFNHYVKKHGKLLVENPEKDKLMVIEILNFKEKMDLVVNKCFLKEERFVNSVKEAFEHFINQRPNKPAELIAKYIDAKLRTGNKESTEEELERTLDKILVLFRFIHGKDTFEAFYKKDLAKRLLIGKSASVDAEKSMLSKLKQECGAPFTSKLEGMFRDIELSKDLMRHFDNYLYNSNIKTTFGLTVNVLTMGFWPSYEPINISLPPLLKQHLGYFENFYKQKHEGRKLQWQHNLDNCTLIGDYQTGKNNGENGDDDKIGKHEFRVSLFQALVLLLFNNTDELSYEEIQKNTAIEAVELKRTLQSLACGKVRVLHKEPKGKDVLESDKFSYNNQFKYPLYKVRINQVQLKETHEEQKMTQEKVIQDRQYQIDAAIVRIMKTRKQVAHHQLVNEVLARLSFPVKAHDFKARIESLIDRDYLHRDQSNVNVYHYVA